MWKSVKIDWGSTKRDIYIRDIACGGLQSLATDKKDRIYSWSSNQSGECGSGKGSDIDTPYLIETLKDKRIQEIGCGGGHSHCCTIDGDHYLWGNNYYEQCNISDSNEVKYIEKP